MLAKVSTDKSLFVQQANDFQLTSNYGHPIRKKGPGGYNRPYSLYLVYIGLTETGQLKVRQVYDKHFDNSWTIEQAETELFDLAERNVVLGRNFENLTWNERCYLTFVAAVPGWKFYWRDSGTHGFDHDGIIFREKKVTHGRTRKTYKENKSFYDGIPTNVVDKNGKSHSAVRCINYVLGDNDRPIPPGGDPVDYCFEIYLEAKFEMDSSLSHVTIIIDPDGQNQGPPNLPPVD